MARLVAAKCPNCGAALKLDPRSQWVTCTYCSTSSFIQIQGRPAPTHPTGPLIVVQAPRGPNPALIAIPIGVALALCAAGASVVVALSGQSRTSSVATPTGTTTTTTSPRTARSPVNPDSVSASDRPLLTDVNSDGAPDAVVLVSRYESGATRTRLAACDGRSGEYRWTSEELGRSAHQLKNAIFEGALLVADDSGRLTGYRTSDGGKLWSIATGDKVERFCGGLTPGRGRIRIQDESFEDVELSTGARHKVSGKPDCKPANTDERPRELGHPRTWKSEVMPPEIESYGCGSTRFMGTWNFVLEDRCAPKLKADTERLAGLRPGS